ncbi:C6 domain-containing protein [Caenorhabditis elegans]|nr:C6 domain-containing protein [Caenorhabditis elegans]CBW44375.1 C6 domain-containing protein [Caenorhabditis elegans]|eukprot:NP_001256930.1 Uncharacterized protein CELE_F26F2.10 [Caenorhabditis elegans]
MGTNADGCSTSKITCKQEQGQTCTLSIMGQPLTEKSSINLQCNNDGTWSDIGDEALNNVNHVSCTCTPEPTS